jgi:nicotinate phosphoribosyltransferase
MENKTIMTDFYELTMAQTYFNEGKKDEEVYFDIFFRKNPFEGGYTLSGGLDETINYINNFKFSDSDIEYLRSLGNFNEEFLNYLKDLKFKGDIYAVPDGTVVFPNEAVLTVKCDIITAQLLETALLANFNHGSLVTTAAKRITNEARNGDKKIPVMEFGARRARGIDSAIEASKCAYIGGCVGTSNTLAGKRYGIPVLGTMAHSLVTEMEDEYEAFLGYAKSNPDNCVFLVDTYDTLRSGIPNAIRVANDYLKPNGYKFKGIRIDSGDLAYLSKEARKMLDEAGYNDATICLSNGLDEFTIRDLLEQGAVIDSIGAGDNIAAPKERVGGVYKLVAVEKDGEAIPRIKVSNDSSKTINPGYKKVYRFYDKETGYALGDVIALNSEKIQKDKFTLVHPVETWKKTQLENYDVRELLEAIFVDGELVYNDPTIKEKQAYAEKEFNTLYPEVRRINKPHEYYVDLTDKLRELKNELISSHTNNEKGYQLVKK